jgi:hypothetical protein
MPAGFLRDAFAFAPPQASSTAAASSVGPADPSGAANAYFGAPHQHLLRQCLAAVGQRVQARRTEARDKRRRERGAEAGRGAGQSEDEEEGDEEEDETTVVAFDLGSGLGASAEWLAQSRPDIEVYAVDTWERDHYAATLREFSGNDALAAQWQALPDPYAQFLVNTWDSLCITPYRLPASRALRQLKGVGVYPDVVFVDAALQYGPCKRVLEEILSQFYGLCHYGHFLGSVERGALAAGPETAAMAGRFGLPPFVPFIVGGGWDLSEDVRRAVSEVAAQRDLRLHVEEGRAWTLCGECVTVTRNRLDPRGAAAPPAALTAREIADAQAKRVVDASLDHEARVQGWLKDVCDVVNNSRERDEDVAALRKAVGTHGRGSSAGTDVWIDECAAGRRHMTPLMHACKVSKPRMVRALVEEHGALVGKIAPVSLYTALIIAAYDGDVSIVEYLLSKGADPAPRNKFNEDALMAAEKGAAEQQRGGGRGGGKDHEAVVGMIKAELEFRQRDAEDRGREREEDENPDPKNA